MARYTIAGANGESPDRSRLITQINVGTYEEPEWAIMGYHVTDSSVEYDNDIETSTDILGNAFITAHTAALTQTFSGQQIKAGDAVMNHIADIAIVQKDARKLVNQDMLIIHDYLRDEQGRAFAERYPQSAVVLTSNGGDGGNPIASEIEVRYGGERSAGHMERDEQTGKNVFVLDE